MEILTQMVAAMLSRGEVKLSLPQDTQDYIGSRAVETLGRIRMILADDALDDPECFNRIERIVGEMESIRIDCGGRHDFG